MFYWRDIGFSYLRYSQLCAQALRSVVKVEAKPGHGFVESGVVKTMWKDGKPLKKRD
uniref:Mitochondrial F1F0 ATP synthase subunit epsilon n=1 Tax=Echinococcus granulosus TaxID=6210 RepID=A0A068WT88_ECHGR|nr:mitochondrial F1F0 ATP synthase subunit epsilon [Echinococcus granulosus]